MATLTGTPGNDGITGTGVGDDFHLEQGGEDTAFGGGGGDVFHMGGAFDAGDSLDGGTGNDILRLDGDYSAGVVVGSALRSIERIELAAGHSYSLSGFSDGVFGARAYLDGRALDPSDHLVIDLSALSISAQVFGGHGVNRIIGGSGADSLWGGSGRNVFDGGGGDDYLLLGGDRDAFRGGGGRDFFDDGGHGVFTATDKLNAGSGEDTLELTGDYAGPIIMRDDTIRGIEHITLQGKAFALTMADGNVAAGQILDVQGYFTQGLVFDASAETDGGFHVSGAHEVSSTLIGGGGDDSLYGGLVDDKLFGGAGNDYLSGYGGEDWLVGGLGQDTLLGATKVDHFVYLEVGDSPGDAPDLIKGLVRVDKIDLSAIDANAVQDGDQAFHMVAAFTGAAAELVIHDDATTHMTTVSGDIDGDGAADLVIRLQGDHADFDNFVL